jgi:prevent-host-death family protein
MPKRYSLAEARSNLPAIIDQAAAGQEIELTRRGKPVAVVISLRRLEGLRSGRTGFADAYRSFLKNHSLVDVGIEPDSFDAIRDRDPGREIIL